MELSNDDVSRLLIFFNILLYDIEEKMSQTQDIQEIDHYEERQEFLREWITRFSRRIGRDTHISNVIQKVKEEMERTERRSILRKHAILTQFLLQLTDALELSEDLVDDVDTILRQFNDNGL